ncbi:MAG: NAD(P)-dependent glycerol-3-phosphate dehydrogenase [Betaproteobacteria bacterium]|nr:NAD(P)-dependent glycerol-3-phosphate dehydrogenase [Betaproteobacteria bacterium]
MKIAVLGAGAWGTALAISFSGRHAVSLWGRDPAQLEVLARERRNRRYLPDVALPETLNIVPQLAAALSGVDLVLIVTPTGSLTEVLTLAKPAHAPILWACKGFDRASGKLPHEIVAELMPPGTLYGALSGPSFALEVARGLPCALTLAANDFAFAQSMAAELNGPALRIYSSDDLIGVELGGALKNVMAIAAGICDGMKLGTNARAALITRGLAEMVRLGVAMGGKAETFMGLTGLGDLVLTATGDLSRNRTVGIKLAEGKTLDVILAELGHVAEGVNSAQTALKLAVSHQVDMPITAAVNAVLFENANPRETVKRLLSREARTEVR